MSPHPPFRCQGQGHGQGHGHEHQAVLAQLSWVQRLAHQVCVDAAQAEDVTQESMLAAFQQTRPRGVPLRHWLGGVVRNQARMALRRARRRPGIEAQGARPEAEPAAGDIVERAATQRTVVEAVLALDEPYRTTLLQRYFDERTPTEIARASGVPIATVKTRLRRGLDRLRASLRTSLGDDDHPEAYLAALIPLASMELRRRAGAAGSTQAARVGSRPAFSWPALALGALAVVAAAIVGIVRHRHASPPPSFDGQTVRGEAGRGQVTDRAQSGTTDSRRAPATPAHVTGQPATRRIALTARVLTVDGVPCPGVRVAASAFDSDRDARNIGTTDPSGIVQASLDADLHRIFVPEGAWITVLSGSVFPSAAEAQTPVIVARPRRVAGIVTDLDGTPVAGARLTYRTELDLRTRFSMPLDQVAGVEWTTRAAADGSFAFEAVSELPQARVVVEAWDCETSGFPVDAVGSAWVPCRVRACGEETTWIHGTVHASSGPPLERAAVSLDSYAARTDQMGRFRIDAAAAPESTALWVACPGYAPHRIERPDAGWPRQLDVTLQPAVVALAGQIVDRNGRPRAGVLVDLADPTPFGLVRRETTERFEMTTLEGFGAAAGTTRVRTDADGSFRIAGLTRRVYRLTLHDPASMDGVVLGPFEPGTPPLELTLPDTPDRARIAGRVVDADGTPIGGVRLSLRRYLDAAQVHGPSVVADDNGRFAFEGAMPRDAWLHAFAGGAFAMTQIAIEEFTDSGHIELTLPRIAAFYLQSLDERTDVHRFVLQDLSGEPVPLQQVDLGGAFTMKIGSIDDGRSAVYRVPVGSYSLVLQSRDGERDAIPLELRTGPPLCVTF